MTKQKTYSEKLRDPRWQKLRLDVMNRDKFTCKLCGDKETTLNVHHLSYNGNPWDTDKRDLITYCEHCHTIVEYYKQLTIVRLKKYNSDEGKMFIVQTNDNYIHIELLYSDGGISTISTFQYIPFKDQVKFFKPVSLLPF